MYNVCMKTCRGCQQVLPYSEFGVNKAKSDGLQTQCKGCRNKYAKSWYNGNRQEHRKRIRKSRIKLKQDVYDYLLQHPCACGESNPILLEFDHDDPLTKTNSIARLVGYGMRNQVFQEIEKCTVRCVVCHRLRTAEQFGWYSWVEAQVQVNSSLS